MIQVEHLSKVYGKGENEVVALNDVSFSIKKGEFVAIIGPSGSGKSTLLHIPLINVLPESYSSSSLFRILP